MTVTITSSLRIRLVAGIGATVSGPVVANMTTDQVFNANNPTQTLTEMLNEISSAQLAASVEIDATALATYPLYIVPNNRTFIPTSIIFALNNINGTGLPPSININYNGTFLVDDTRSTTFALTNMVIVTPGLGYAPGNILTAVGGTFTSAATATVDTTKLVNIAVNTPGTVYAPNDTVTLSGGTSTTNAVLTVLTTQLVSATISAGGTAYDGGSPSTFDVTIAGGTSTGAAVVNVTTDGTGVVTTINSITTPGSYTVLPTLLGNLATGDDGTNHGTDLALDLVFGIETVEIAIPGVYTANSSTFTQLSSNHSGSGAIFDSALFGVNTIEISNPGSYSIVAPNHISTTGGGSGFTFDGGWTLAVSLFSNIINVTQLLAITDFTQTASDTGEDYHFLTADQTLSLNITTASTYSIYKVKVFVFGFQS